MGGLYRYELAFNGELQDIGFLQGMYELGLDDGRADDLVRNFDTLMKIPSGVFCPNARSFFTEKGIDVSREDISRLVSAYREHGLFQVAVGTLQEVMLDVDDILYSDDYQAIIRQDAMKGRIRWEIPDD